MVPPIPKGNGSNPLGKTFFFSQISRTSSPVKPYMAPPLIIGISDMCLETMYNVGDIKRCEACTTSAFLI